MMLPKSIQICGIEFTINQVEVVDKGNGFTRGQVNFETDTIEIDKHLPEDRKIQVLIHECLHALLDLTGNREINEDEKTVQSIATALYCSLKENKLLSFS